MSTVGIVGAGQLARMLALAGYPLGLQFVFLDPAPDACAGQVGELIVAAYDDDQALSELAQRCDVITFDFENVPAQAAQRMQQLKPVFPPPAALAVAQDRLQEKCLFSDLGIATAAHAAVDDGQALQQAIADIGLPAVLKTRRLGYDGKGQYLICEQQMIDDAYAALAGVPLIVEQWVDFDLEVSLLAVRSTSGEIAFYPLAENRHQNGILSVSLAPYSNQILQEKAQIYAQSLLEELDYIGLLAIEFFVIGDQLLANEMAPRVHNSGHWTIEGAVISQFENHLRAGLGWPLGATEAHAHSAMLNLIGTLPNLKHLALSDVHCHDYGKAARAGRKLGHLTLCRDDRAVLMQDLARLERAIEC